MMSWIYQHYSDRAKRIMRADDDVFVKVEELLDFLFPINHHEPHYIGQAGRGKEEELGKMGLAWDDNYCMGGPGVLISMNTLSQLVSSIPHCLNHLVTDHEDVELGRCIKLATGKSCTWSYEMVNTFYHNPGGDRGTEVVPSKLKARVLQHAITIHPIKDPSNMEGLAV